ncbi:MAG: hypothetical protein C0623_02920 [Desulfuromonas sp.]|nr:MAG: hypothetical protein C0623_02920 [Desulfuromonas sp.]
MSAVTLSPWQTPPDRPELDRRQVHLWRFRLTLAGAERTRLKSLLSAAELARADRLLDAAKADQFIVARIRLRQILGRYLDLPPAEILFDYGKHGKPGLAAGITAELEFNLAHAGSRGLLAVSAAAALGVDIEWIDPQLEYGKIAAQFFTPDEVEALKLTAAGRQRRAFYRTWTRKEAWLKGQGGGFSSPQFQQPGAGWSIRSFTVGRDYLGAVACAGSPSGILRWDFDWPQT